MAVAGLRPDPWQVEVLTSTAERVILLCHRQAGKSMVAAAAALHHALNHPESLILLLSPVERQSKELYKQKLRRLWRKAGSPQQAGPPRELSLELANGSRIEALPGSEEGIRGYSGVNLLVIDEAARVPDELYFAVRPFLAASRGRLMALSTPFGRRGWFFEAWHSDEDWHRVSVKADQCPRLTKKFLDSERLALGHRWYEQEYMNAWLGISEGVFDPGDVAAMVSDGVEADPLE